MTLERLLTRLPEKSFDGDTDKKMFEETLNKFPNLAVELRYQLTLPCNTEWIRKADEGNVSFSLYDDSWKISNIGLIANHVQLTFSGKSKTPVVSIDIHRKPV